MTDNEGSKFCRPMTSESNANKSRKLPLFIKLNTIGTDFDDTYNASTSCGLNNVLQVLESASNISNNNRFRGSNNNNSHEDNEHSTLVDNYHIYKSLSSKNNNYYYKTPPLEPTIGRTNEYLKRDDQTPHTIRRLSQQQQNVIYLDDPSIHQYSILLPPF